MKLTDIFEEKELNFLQDLIHNENYELIRIIANELLQYDDRDFAYNFDYMLARTAIFPISGTDPETNEKIEYANEVYFLYFLQYKIIRAVYILEAYSEHAHNVQKPISDELEETLEDYFFKEQFVYLKLRRVVSKEALTSIATSINKLQKPVKKTVKATIEGQQINLLERYFLLNELLGLEKTISTLNISKGEKDKLLGLILDCNPTNARHLMNGKYDAHLRTDLINNYLKNLKK